MHISQILAFISEHKELFATFLVSLIAIIKLTSWGRAQSAALDAVISVIERIGASEIKTRVARSEADLLPVVRDAIHDSVAKADPKKTPESIAQRILREIFRGL